MMITTILKTCFRLKTESRCDVSSSRTNELQAWVAFNAGGWPSRDICLIDSSMRLRARVLGIGIRCDREERRSGTLYTSVECHRCVARVARPKVGRVHSEESAISALKPPCFLTGVAWRSFIRPQKICVCNTLEATRSRVDSICRMPLPLLLVFQRLLAEVQPMCSSL